MPPDSGPAVVVVVVITAPVISVTDDSRAHQRRTDKRFAVKNILLYQILTVKAKELSRKKKQKNVRIDGRRSKSSGYHRRPRRQTADGPARSLTGLPPSAPLITCGWLELIKLHSFRFCLCPHPRIASRKESGDMKNVP